MRNNGVKVYTTIFCYLILFLILRTSFVYSLNPQIYYKSIYVYGDSDESKLVFNQLMDIMIIDSNVKLLDRVTSKNDISSADVIVFIPDENLPDSKELSLISEWFLLGGKLIITLPSNDVDGLEVLNTLLEDLGSKIRYGYIPEPIPKSFRFELFGEVNEYLFDSRIQFKNYNVLQMSLLFVEGELSFGSGGVIYIGDANNPVIVGEYIPVYSDLFTWYYSKVLSLSFRFDQSGNSYSDIQLLLEELLSWGVTPYLNPNVYSIGLTLFTGVLAVAAYVSVKLYG